ncbi:helix-turn-helix domain-containing protein [Vagococcus elongatus]|uniref:Helicase Helix-turn-helix domain-containing protein n=1 Tax=Vagococcus elongatus TaxID=180344 RepID=A0A430B5I0_9ENTE|nr:helix-turn-helix domain-containing protein [Vagococcus elongatus]RSU15573.1 hypothetical protein CBF29_00420 [Vagococcus elongatus]
MTMSIDTFILTLFTHGYKARIGTLYQLLIGKRTSSILCYGHFYGQLPYFGLLPKLDRQVYQQSVHQLTKKNFLTVKDEKAEITQEGRKYLADGDMINYDKLNHFVYGKSWQSFFDLLLFSTQVTAELKAGNSSYPPVENSPYKHFQLKKWLAHQLERQSKEDFIQAFSAEWHQLIETLPELEGDFLTNQLTGADVIGKTYHQLGSLLGLNEFELTLFQRHCIHWVMTIVAGSPETYPLMNSLYQLVRQPNYNQSAYQTYQLYLKVKKIDQLIAHRRLKESTVLDHLIEFAIIDEKFPFFDVLTPEIKEMFFKIEKSSPDVRDWKISVIQELYPEVSFFEMRLYQIWRVKGRMTSCE